MILKLPPLIKSVSDETGLQNRLTDSKFLKEKLKFDE